MSKRWLRFPRPARAAALASALVLSVPVVVLAAAPHAAACLPSICGVPGGPASPTQIFSKPPVLTPPPGPIIVSSVGDSFASGEGAGGYLPQNSNDYSFWRHTSPYAPSALAWLYLETTNKPAAGSYPISENSMTQTWVGGDSLYFGASSGATTYDLDEPQIDTDAAKGTNQQRNVPQINYVDPRSNLVYYQFGGNNVGFGHIIAAAIMAYLVDRTVGLINGVFTPPGSASADWQSYQAAAVQAVINQESYLLPQMQNQIGANLAEIHMKAPNAAIVVSLYPVAVKSSGNPDIDMMAGGSLDRIYGYATQLNKAITDEVSYYNSTHPASARVLLFDPNTAGPNGTSIVAGHEEGTGDPYVNGVVLDPNAEVGKMLHLFQQSFHPNREGDIAIGQALATFTQAHLPQLYPTAPSFYQIATKPQPPFNQVAPSDLYPMLNQLITAFCGYAPNRSLAGCPAPPSGGGGGSGPPTVGSPAFDVMVAGWLADLGDDGSTGTGANGDGTTAGGGGSTASGGDTGTGGTVTLNFPPGTTHSYYWDVDHWVVVIYTPGVSGNTYVMLEPGVQPDDAPPAPSSTTPPTTTPPQPSPPADDPLQDPSSVDESGDGSQADPGSDTSGGSTATGGDTTGDPGTIGGTDTGTGTDGGVTGGDVGGGSGGVGGGGSTGCDPTDEISDPTSPCDDMSVSLNP